jgi:NAD(P)-dependent dehydrogenase (short-subunit alcohol dehydrogenase family)
MLLEGKVAIVTGAGRGIGQVVALGLAAEGAKVVVADLGAALDGSGANSDPAQATVAAIEAAGGEAMASTGSVADAVDVGTMVEACVARFGRVDILVNNAGIIIRNLLVDTSDEDWDRQIAVHLRGSFLCARAVIPHMTRQKWGRIINFTSASGLISIPGSNAYTTAKSGVLAFTRLLAQELVFHGITANAIAPSAQTRMSTPSPPAVQRVRRALGVMTSAGGGADRSAGAVAAGVAYLASDEAAYVNGQVIGIGGERIDLWSEPQILATAFNDAPWSVDAFRRRFPVTLGRGLSNPVPSFEG